MSCFGVDKPPQNRDGRDNPGPIQDLDSLMCVPGEYVIDMSALTTRQRLQPAAQADRVENMFSDTDSDGLTPSPTPLDIESGIFEPRPPSVPAPVPIPAPRPSAETRRVTDTVLKEMIQSAPFQSASRRLSMPKPNPKPASVSEVHGATAPSVSPLSLKPTTPAAPTTPPTPHPRKVFVTRSSTWYKPWSWF